MSILGRQLRMIELLSVRLRNIAVDGRVSGSLFCAIGLHDLTGHFLMAAANRRRCSVLAINDRKLAAFYWRHYDGSELRPIEILGDLIDVGCAPPTDFALIRYVDDKLVGLYTPGRSPPPRHAGFTEVPEQASHQAQAFARDRDRQG